ncbi:MAG: polysaccharide biosynthesis tyrosine autokinase [Pseudomonadota bacterium]
MNYAPRLQKPNAPVGARSVALVDGEAGRSAVFHLVSILRRRWTLLFACIAFGVAIAVLAAAAMPKRYGATAELLLSPPQQAVVDLAPAEGGPGGERAFVESQIELLRSDVLLANAAQRLQSSDVAFGAQTSIAAAMLGGAPPSAEPPSLAEATALLKDMIRVRRKGASYVVAVTASAGAPEAAAAAANAVADSYVADEAAWRIESLRQANVWLEQRLEAVRDDLSASERAVEAFRADNGLLDAGGVTLNARRRADLNADIQAAAAELAGLEARLSEMRRLVEGGGDPETLPGAFQSPGITALKTRRTELSRSLAELSVRYGERHPAIIKARSELAAVADDLARELQRAVVRQNNETEVQRARLAALRADLAGLTDAAALDEQAGLTLRALEREAAADRALYESLLDSYKRSVMFAGAGEGGNAAAAGARIIDAAAPPPSPAFPDLKLFAVAGFFMSAAFGAVLIGLMEAANRRYWGPGEAAEGLDMPLLSSIPLVKPPRKRFAFVKGPKIRTPLMQHLAGAPDGAFADGFRRLRAGLDIAQPGAAPTSVLIASALPEEGKSATAAGYAVTAAAAGRKVLLLDCDLRRPALRRAFGYRGEAGLQDVLAGSATLEEALWRHDGSGLDALFCTKSMPNSSDLLASDIFRRSVEAFKSSYDLIIFDSPPVLPAIDANIIARGVDAVAFCVRWGRTPRAAAETALGMLEESDAPVAGFVMTMIDPVRAAGLAASSHDPFKYYDRYRDYYAK